MDVSLQTLHPQFPSQCYQVFGHCSPMVVDVRYAVVLSILRSTDRRVRFFANVFRARVAASSSRQFICQLFSSRGHGPRAGVLTGGPQPCFEASDSITRSGSNEMIVFPFQFIILVSPQVNSSLLLGDNSDVASTFLVVRSVGVTQRAWLVNRCGLSVVRFH